MAALPLVRDKEWVVRLDREKQDIGDQVATGGVARTGTGDPGGTNRAGV